MFYVLFYEKGAGYEERQAPHLEAHRRHFMEAVSQGVVLLAGSLQDPCDGAALLVMKAESVAAVEAFASKDPYVIHGVVARWHVRRWDVVAGALFS